MCCGVPDVPGIRLVDGWWNEGSRMTLPSARAGVLRIEPQASQAEPLIANAEWWAADPEFHEFLDEMERQDDER